MEQGTSRYALAAVSVVLKALALLLFWALLTLPNPADGVDGIADALLAMAAGSVPPGAAAACATACAMLPLLCGLAGAALSPYRDDEPFRERTSPDRGRPPGVSASGSP